MYTFRNLRKIVAHMSTGLTTQHSKYLKYRVNGWEMEHVGAGLERLLTADPNKSGKNSAPIQDLPFTTKP